MSLEFAGNWARVPGARYRNLDLVRVSKGADVGVWHKLDDGRWCLVNVFSDGRAPTQVFGRTKTECRQLAEAARA